MKKISKLICFFFFLFLFSCAVPPSTHRIYICGYKTKAASHGACQQARCRFKFVYFVSDLIMSKRL